MRNLALVGLGVALALAESMINGLLPFDLLTPDLVLPLALYMGMAGFNTARGAAIAFIVGYFVDALQPGSPICLNMFVLVALFLVARLLTTRLLLAGFFFQVLMLLAGSVASSLIVVGVRAIFERQAGGVEPTMLAIATRAAATTIAGPLVIGLVRRVEARGARRREERARL